MDILARPPANHTAPLAPCSPSYAAYYEWAMRHAPTLPSAQVQDRRRSFQAGWEAALSYALSLAATHHDDDEPTPPGGAACRKVA